MAAPANGDPSALLVPPFELLEWGSLASLTSSHCGDVSSQAPPECPLEFDGCSPLALHLDTEGSAVLYLPAIPGLDVDATITALEGSLAACEAAGPPPQEDSSDQSGRRQWVGDFGIGWKGPRRWRRGSWALRGAAQLAPLLAARGVVEAAVDAAAKALEAAQETAAAAAAEAAAAAATAAAGNGAGNGASEGASEAAGLAVLCSEAAAAPLAAHTIPRLRERYNTVLVNRYVDGAAGVKWHADDDRWYCCRGDDRPTNARSKERPDIAIASVSLGACRWFEFRRKPKGRPGERRRLRLRLRPGSLLVMAGATQQHWQHQLPADPSVTEKRYNLTFRRVLTADEDPTLLLVPD